MRDRVLFFKDLNLDATTRHSNFVIIMQKKQLWYCNNIKRVLECIRKAGVKKK